MSERRFVAVFGPSGSGKSSVLRAGLVPRLPGPVLVFTPGARPLEECAVRLSSYLGLTASEVCRELRGDPESLGLLVRQALAAGPADAELVLVVDQFEEVFTLCRDRDERVAFLTALITAAHAGQSRCRVVIGVRADFYARCAQHADLVAAWQDAMVTVTPMSADELRRAITGPARAAECAVEGALVTMLVAEAHGEAGVLPLLSHALLQTWHRRKGNLLTLAGFQAAGGIDGALAKTAEAEFELFTDQQKRIARAVFLRLVALGDGTEDTKRRVSADEMDADHDTAVVLERLTAARLLVRAIGTVEITHEALVRAWPRLREWLAAGREEQRVHRDLTEAAATWEKHGRDRDSLLRGTRLEVAQGWLTQGGTPNAQESRFLDASLRAVRTGRRKRKLVVAFAVLLVSVTAVTGLVAAHRQSMSQDLQRRGLSSTLAAKSERMIRQPDAAMLLAVAAVRQAPTSEARDALLSAQAHPFIARLHGRSRPDPFASIGLSHDGTMLAAGDSTGWLKLWDTGSFKPSSVEFTGHSLKVTNVAFHLDRRRMTTTDIGGTVKTWDVDSGKELSSMLIPRSSGPFDLTVAPDGRTVVLSDQVEPDQGAVTLWDAVSGQRIGQLSPDQPGRFWTARPVFRADGRQLAVPTPSGVLIWDMAAARPVRTVAGAVGRLAALSPDGTTLALYNGTTDPISVWKVDTGQQIATLPDHEGQILGLMFSRDGRTLLANGDKADGTGILSLWNTTTSQKITTLAGHTGAVLATAVSHDNRTVFTAGHDGSVAVWRLDPQSVQFDLPVTASGSLALSPDRRAAAFVSGHGTVLLWDTETRKISATLTGHAGDADSLAFSFDGRTIAHASTSGTTATITLWEVASLRKIATFTTAASGPGALAFSSRTNHLAFARSVDDYGVVTLWDTDTAKEITSVSTDSKWLMRHVVKRVTLASDDHTVAFGTSSGDVHVVDVISRATSQISAHDKEISALAFSRDGAVLASGSTDHTAKLWQRNHTALRELSVLTWHAGAVHSVAFSPDGHTLATAGADERVHLWDTTTGVRSATVTGHASPVVAVAFDQEGHGLTTVGEDRTLRRWSLDEEQVRARLCEVIGRSVGPRQEQEILAGAVPGRPCHR